MPLLFLGLVTVAIIGAPGLGRDFGGVLSALPGFLLLALLAAALRVGCSLTAGSIRTPDLVHELLHPRAVLVAGRHLDPAADIHRERAHHRDGRSRGRRR